MKPLSLTYFYYKHLVGFTCVQVGGKAGGKPEREKVIKILRDPLESLTFYKRIVIAKIQYDFEINFESFLFKISHLKVNFKIPLNVSVQFHNISMPGIVGIWWKSEYLKMSEVWKLFKTNSLSLQDLVIVIGWLNTI